MTQGFRLRFLREMEMYGFVRSAGGVVCSSPKVSCVVLAAVSRRIPEVAYGLWFVDLGGLPAPVRHNHHHIYGGAETICQLQIYSRRESCISADQELAQREEVIISMAEKVSICLHKMLDIDVIVKAYAQGLFKNSLIKAEARAYLERLLE